MPFPFSCIVISFPDARAARAAQDGPLQCLQETYWPARIIATTDPMGARVGSGGGTLAALEQATNSCNESNQIPGNILVIHAGGESSRCPTQMVMGKAWTSLPTTRHSGILQTPITLWLEQCGTMFQNLPSGSVVVIASDTLLYFPVHESSTSVGLDWKTVNPSSVIGVAVPAPLETARNHGVYDLVGNERGTTVHECRTVLQKPSMEFLLEITTTSSPRGSSKPPMHTAWIDTGIIIFLPEVAKSLQQLANGPLALCTEQGLRQAYDDAQNGDNSTEMKSSNKNLTQFCQSAALKVDLYTHMLQAFRLSGSTDTSKRGVRKQAYVNKFGGSSPESKQLWGTIYDILAPHTLLIWTEPEGQFLHLGTTRELMQFWQASNERPRGSGNGENKYSRISDERQELCRFFARRLGMTHRSKTVMLKDEADGSNLCHELAVVYHSVVIACRIGPQCVVEHCDINEGMESIAEIGNHCLVSGLRPNGCSQTGGPAFVIPDNMIVQMLPLNHDEFVLMVLGVDDPIKTFITQDVQQSQEGGQIYGKALADFLGFMDITDRDLWPPNETRPRIIWTAQMHPVVQRGQGGFDRVFAWLFDFCRGNCVEGHDARRELWKHSRRLSLAQIRDEADASLEFAYRQQLEEERIPKAQLRYQLSIETIRAMLLEGRHVEIPFDGNPDDLETITKAIVEAALQALLTPRYDIVSRACTILACFLEGATSDAKHVPSIEKMVTSDDMGIKSMIHQVMEATGSLGSICGSETWDLSFTTQLLHSLGKDMIQKCVSVSTTTESPTVRGTPIANLWVCSTAPARIDFAGGWTDTPPICFDYGSAVTGVSVTLRKRGANGGTLRPLACRCRMLVDGGWSSDGLGPGLLLRTEQRSLESEGCEVISQAEVFVSSFDDFEDFLGNPQSPCALLKCALYTTGFRRTSSGLSFQQELASFCGHPNDGVVRLELISTSLLPQGSGLGTSSILGGCVLASILKVLGIPPVGGASVASGEERSPDDDSDTIERYLVDKVLVLEQNLSTGGGFQDQVNGLVSGGAKFVQCEPRIFPPQLHIERLRMPVDLEECLSRRLRLAFTGKTRLAKNILDQVIQRWAQRTPEIVETVRYLMQCAKRVREKMSSHPSVTDVDGTVDAIGTCLTEYWQLKKRMAGPSSGVEPEQVTKLMSRLEPYVAGMSLCGAGGGGFLVVITHRACPDLVSEDDGEDVVWYDCIISVEGVRVGLGREHGPDYFDPEWLKSQ